MKSLAEFSDAEITREYFRRMVSKLGDQRVCVGVSTEVRDLRIENARLRDEVAIRDITQGTES